MKCLRLSTDIWRCVLASLALASCDRAPPTPDTDAASAAASANEEQARRLEEVNRVIKCCMALQDRWPARGGPFITASKECVASYADVEAGRRSAEDVFREVAKILPQGASPPACK